MRNKYIGFALVFFVLFFNLKLFSTYLKSKKNFIYKERNLTKIEQIISQLDIKTKIASLLMVNFYNDINLTLELINRCRISSFIIMSYNVNENYENFRKKLKFIKSNSNILPITFSVDQEGGHVERLSPILGATPPLRNLFNEKGVDGVKEIAHKFGRELKELGIDINLAPVVDKIYDRNSIVRGRVFSIDNNSNIIAAQKYIDILSSYGVTAALKHFPGYGTVSLDPHYSICIDKSYTIEDLIEPFLKLTNVNMLMSSHVIYAKVDNVPGTLSPRVISYATNFFDGIIITDDIMMDSISLLYDYKMATLKAILAGNDIILLVDKDGDYNKWVKKIEGLIEYLYNAYNSGELSEERIDYSLRKILAFKFNL